MGDYPELDPISLPPNTVRDICRRAMTECNWKFEKNDEKWRFRGKSGNAIWGEANFELELEILRNRDIRINIATDIDQTRPVRLLLDSIDKYVREEQSALSGLTVAEREARRVAACNGLVFVSYHHQDRKFTQRLANDIYLFGFDVWIDETSLHIGDIWPDEITENIGKAVAVVVVGSTEGLKAPWVQKEFDFAIDRQKKILPVIYKQTEFPEWFRQRVEKVQYRNLSRQKYGPGLSELIDVLNQQVGT